ncbi:MAG: hypothetical protein R2867_43905 [Caldilineaceae bacterium]
MTASPQNRSRPFEQPASEFLLPHDNCYWVIPGRFMAGEYPGAYRATVARQRLQSYLAAGITEFIDLTHPNDGLAPYENILLETAAHSISQRPTSVCPFMI